MGCFVRIVSCHRVWGTCWCSPYVVFKPEDIGRACAKTGEKRQRARALSTVSGDGPDRSSSGAAVPAYCIAYSGVVVA